MTDARAVREVFVEVDEPDEKFGVVIGRTVRVDGREMLLPGDTIIKAEVGKTEALAVTLTFFASSVKFTQPE